MRDGYVVMAYGSERYFRQARDLAVSIRVCDNTRPVCLLHDGNAPEEVRRVFHLERKVRFDLGGYLNKLYLYDFSPFNRTMYIDTDCLMVKRDIETWWTLLKDKCFSVTGEKKTKGSWGEWPDISKVCDKYRIPYVVTMNSGVIYVRKSATSRKLFDTALGLVNEKENGASWFVPAVSGYNDEPILAISMGTHGISPVSGKSVDGVTNTLQTSTIRSAEWDFSIEKGTCMFRKGKKKVSPTILHLCGYRKFPELVTMYDREIKWLEAQASRM
jgi:hypothetical protein